MPTMTLSAKKCVNCNRDVTNGQRMKDSSGRYWCVNCGTLDQKKKASASAELCSNCGDKFPSAKLTKMGASKICAGCLKKRNKGPGLLESLRGGGGGTDKGKLVKMLAILGVLAVVAVWRYSTLHS